MQRIIIGGAARSGTTLIQALVGATANYHVFPESHYFPNLFMGKRNCLLRMLGGLTYQNYILERNLTAIGFDTELARMSKSSGITRFIEILDAEAAVHGMPGWAEKTPANVLCLDRIVAADSRFDLSLKYIMMVRRLDDVCRSQKRAHNVNQTAWRGQFKIRLAHRRWLQSLRTIARFACKDELMVVRYDDLICRPEESLEALSGFLGVTIDTDALGRMPEVASRIVLPWETWKADNFRREISRTAKDEVLSTAELNYLSNADWETEYQGATNRPLT